MTVPIVIKRQQEEINDIKQRLDILESAIFTVKVDANSIDRMFDDMLVSRPGGMVKVRNKPGPKPKDNNAKT